MEKQWMFALVALLQLYAVSVQAKPKYTKNDLDLQLPPVLAPHNSRHEKWMAWKPDQLPSKKSDVDLSKQTDEDDFAVDPLSSLEDPCAAVFCRLGRVCEVSTQGHGVCVCAGDTHCDGHKKTVCGTDGVTYPSHCELHRMACVNGAHIGIDHTGDRCHTSQAEEEIQSDEEDPVSDEEVDIHEDTEAEESKQSEKQPAVSAESSSTKSQVSEMSNETGEDDEESEEISDESDEDDEYYDDDDDEDDEDDEDNNYSEESDSSEESSEIPSSEETSIESECTELEYERLKNSIFQYHCTRVGENDCSEDHSRKQFVANVMFSFFDSNDDEMLTENELADVERRDHLEHVSRFCSLSDMLEYDDQEEDGNISLSELYAAFGIPSVVLDENLRVFKSVVSVGGSVEIKCDVKGSDNIQWKRNGAPLDDVTSDDVKTFEDGSLYIKDLSLHHMGNYTCQDPGNDEVVQTHIMTVHKKPHVRVNPSTQFHITGASVSLSCHADGIPEPTLTWEMNEVALPQSQSSETPDHYILLHNNTRLEINEAVYTRDTGAYKCKAQSAAGEAQDIATVFIENSNVPSYASDEAHETFVVFHDDGYTIYEPNHCNIEHMVVANFDNFGRVPDYSATPRLLCPSPDGTAPAKCVWGDAVNVKNKYIYVSQPELNRVVVVELMDHSNPTEIIPTDKIPVSLHYVEHLDQVWVVCWNSREAGLDGGVKTVLIIREASEDTQHHTVHTQPIANHFDLVKDIFLPPSNDQQQTFDYGYVVHSEQQSLFKVDLKRMQYVKNIDLSEYACVPKSVVFMPFGGCIVVHCGAPAGYPEKSMRLVVDYITDTVLHQTALSGTPHVTPDGRHLVTIAGNSNTLSVYRISDEGVAEHMFDEYTTLHISDVTFFPSYLGRGYDLYATASNRNTVLFINLMTGRVELIEGVGEPLDEGEWIWSTQVRTIKSGGMFGNFLMTPSRDSLVVLNGKTHQVHCEWQNINRGNVLVWVEPQRL